MLLVAGEISVFASYNQTPAPYYHLAKNCDRKSGMAPEYSKGNPCVSRWYDDKMSTGAWQDEKSQISQPINR